MEKALVFLFVLFEINFLLDIPELLGSEEQGLVLVLILICFEVRLFSGNKYRCFPLTDKPLKTPQVIIFHQVISSRQTKLKTRFAKSLFY